MKPAKPTKQATQTPASAPEASEPSEVTPEKPKAAPRARSARPEASKSKLPATQKARELREKLRELAERGIDGEKEEAKRKLARLEARVDFSAKVLATADIFKGPFQGSTTAEPLCRFAPADWDIGAGIKDALRTAAGIECVWRGDELLAKASGPSVRKLAGISAKVAEAFGKLWSQFSTAPGVHPGDRANFILGLTEGMLHEERTGTSLPTRAAADPRTRRKAKPISTPTGVSLHPYSVAVGLGRQIRFEVPLDTLAGELAQTIKGEIE